MKQVKIITLTVLLHLLCVSLFAQNAKLDSLIKRTDISGSADVYFRANLNDDQQTAPPTAFANLNGFAMGMFNIKANHEFKNVGANFATGW